MPDINWKKVKRNFVLYGVPLFYIALPFFMSNEQIVRFFGFFSMCAFFYIMDQLIDLDIKMDFHERLTQHICHTTENNILNARQEINNLRAMIDKLAKDKGNNDA